MTKATTKAKPKALDLEKITDLAGQIHAHTGADSQFGDMLARFQAEEGLKFFERPKGSGITNAVMAGITATSTAGERMALVNWSNAARRAAQTAAKGQ